MAKHKLCCIGYITKDIIATPDNTVHMPGGTAYYFEEAIRHLKPIDFLLVTSVGPEEIGIVDQIIKNGIDVLTIPAKESVCFENIYFNKSQSHRKQRVTSFASPFKIEDLRNIKADIIHLGSLLHNDFPIETVKYLASDNTLSADIQGFLRQIKGNEVYHSDWEEKKTALKYIHTLKTNIEEMYVLTGSTNPHEAALMLADWGVKEVIITFDEKGSLIYSNGEFIDIPAYPTLKVVDATGCGDTYMAGYLYMRSQGKSVYEAGCFGAAMCTIKLQSYGPFNGSEETVRKIIESGSPIIV